MSTPARPLRKSADKSYSKIAAKGAAWHVGLALANKVITATGQFILALLLTPADIGLASMAKAMTGFTSFLAAGSVADVLIQRGKYKKEAGQALWLTFFSVISTSTLITIMGFFSIWAGRRDLSGLLFVIAFISFASIANPILGARLSVNLDFKHLAISYFIGGTTYTLTSVLFAGAGYGPYSLVLSILPQVLLAAGYIIYLEGFPRLERPKLKQIKELFFPTFSMALTSFFINLQTQAPIFFVGLILDARGTGYFSWGWAIAGQTVYLLAVNLRQVLMPIFSKMEKNSDRQIMAVFKTIRVMTAALTITCGIQAFLAEPFIDLFLPLKWHPAGSVVKWFSLGLCLQGLLISVSAWLNSTGQYRTLLISNSIPVISASLFSLIGATYSGIEGASIGGAIGIVAGTSLSIFRFPARFLRRNFRYLFWPSTLTATSWLILYFTIGNSNSPITRIIVSFLFLFISVAIWFNFDDGLLTGFLNNFLTKIKKAVWRNT